MRDYGSRLLNGYGDTMRIVQRPDPQSALDLQNLNRSGPRRETPSRRPLGSVAFRGFDPVNGLRPPQAARETRAIDRVKTSEKRGFPEVDGALRQALVAADEMRIVPA